MIVALLVVGLVVAAAVAYGASKHITLASVKAEVAKLEGEAKTEYNTVKADIAARLKALL